MQKSSVVGLLVLGAIATTSAAAIAAIRPRPVATHAPARLVTAVNVSPRGAAFSASRTHGATMPPGFSPFEGLTLTEAQHAQLKRLNEATKAARRALLDKQRNKTTPLSAADAAELQRTAVTHNEAVRAILTPQQRVRLDANLETLRARYVAKAEADNAAKQAAATLNRAAAQRERQP
jgi:hypothetical protein